MGNCCFDVCVWMCDCCIRCIVGGLLDSRYEEESEGFFLGLAIKTILEVFHV